jgi:cysteine synthase A
MEALGAELHIIPSHGGGMTESLTIANPPPIAAYHAMADEIWRQTTGQIDGFVQSVGTAGSLRGNAERLRHHIEAKVMAKRLAREEGLFPGTSTGANVVAAVRLAERVGPNATVVTVMCDTGMKYPHTEGTFR